MNPWSALLGQVQQSQGANLMSPQQAAGQALMAKLMAGASGTSINFGSGDPTDPGSGPGTPLNPQDPFTPTDGNPDMQYPNRPKVQN